ncbi:hypothetical protein [Thalassotalea sp. PLHSN55]|uniref:hypothetical protein n=1 Tax=Thalassotalea sp. PLHSN55 TaxID=3435888 RepID=UPI003F85ADB7
MAYLYLLSLAFLPWSSIAKTETQVSVIQTASDTKQRAEHLVEQYLDGQHLDDQQSLLRVKINDAITKFEQTPRKKWAYQVSRYENEEGDITSSIEAYQPNLSKEKPWTLLQLNGELPTVKQRQKFQQQKRHAKENKDSGQSYSVALREMINVPSLHLLAENEKYITMGFKVSLKKLGDDAIGKLDGELLYHKKHQFIEQITINNNAEFSPLFTANITELTLSFYFTHIDGSILPLQQDMIMKGSFAYFTKIDERSTDSYSHFQKR